MTTTTSDRIYAVARDRIEASTFAEIRAIDWQTVSAAYAQAWDEQDGPMGWESPDDIDQTTYASIAEDIRDVFHGGLADALSADAWTAPDYDEDCYLSSNWD